MNPDAWAEGTSTISEKSEKQLKISKMVPLS